MLVSGLVHSPDVKDLRIIRSAGPFGHAVVQCQYKTCNEKETLMIFDIAYQKQFPLDLQDTNANALEELEKFYACRAQISFVYTLYKKLYNQTGTWGWKKRADECLQRSQTIHVMPPYIRRCNHDFWFYLSEQIKNMRPHEIQQMKTRCSFIQNNPLKQMIDLFIHEFSSLEKKHNEAANKALIKSYSQQYWFNDYELKTTYFQLNLKIIMAEQGPMEEKEEVAIELNSFKPSSILYTDRQKKILEENQKKKEFNNLQSQLPEALMDKNKVKKPINQDKIKKFQTLANLIKKIEKNA